MFQVRAGSLQDLVYKSGQAGITKASVTVKFDNTDKSCGPLGYEQYEEITVTRQVSSLLILIMQYINQQNQPAIIHFFFCLDYRWWEEQIPYKWNQCDQQTGHGHVLLSSAKCQQSSLSHYAGKNHKGSQYETSRGMDNVCESEVKSIYTTQSSSIVFSLTFRFYPW